ncbi:MAG: hypothetical protein ACOZNI_25895 [Myxococcota bacterium]
MIGLLACAIGQRPLGEGEAPNLVVLLPAEAAAYPEEADALVRVWAAVEARERAVPALLASQWSPREGANTLPGVLSLYGYHTAAAGLSEPGFRDVASPAWLTSADEPFLVVDATGASVDAWRDALRERRLLARTAVVVVPLDGFDSPRLLAWYGPRAPAALADGALASTLDVMPTLVRAGRGTVPTDAVGTDLADGAARRRAVFQEAADGAFVVRSWEHVLRVRVAEPLPSACPDDAVLTDAAGAPSSDPEARAALWEAMRAWRGRLAAKTARERLGADDFTRLNAEQGYWQ